MTPAVGRLLLREGYRHPQLRLSVRELEVGRHHADDRVRLAVERERPPDDPGVRAEAPLPERVAQQDNLVRAGPVLLGGERAAVSRRDAEQLEEVRVDALPVDALGLARAGQ